MSKRFFVCLLAALAVPVLLACGGGDDDDGASTSPTSSAAQPTQSTGAQASPTRAAAAATSPATSASPTAAAGAAGGDVASAVQAVKNMRSFRAAMTLEGAGAPSTQATLAVVLPDKAQFTIAGVEYITVGADTYIRAGGSWIKSPVSVPLFDLRIIATTVAAVDASNTTRGGTATVDGRSCQLYTSVAGGTSTEMCLATGGVPVRIVATSPAGKVTLVFTNVNENIDIRAPI